MNKKKQKTAAINPAPLDMTEYELLARQISDVTRVHVKWDLWHEDSRNDVAISFCFSFIDYCDFLRDIKPRHKRRDFSLAWISEFGGFLQFPQGFETLQITMIHQELADGFSYHKSLSKKATRTFDKHLRDIYGEAFSDFFKVSMKKGMAAYKTAYFNKEKGILEQKNGNPLLDGSGKVVHVSMEKNPHYYFFMTEITTIDPDSGHTKAVLKTKVYKKPSKRTTTADSIYKWFRRHGLEYLCRKDKGFIYASEYLKARDIPPSRQSPNITVAGADEMGYGEKVC